MPSDISSCVCVASLWLLLSTNICCVCVCVCECAQNIALDIPLLDRHLNINSGPHSHRASTIILRDVWSVYYSRNHEFHYTTHTNVGVVASYIKHPSSFPRPMRMRVANRRCTYALDVLSGAQRVFLNAPYYTAIVCPTADAMPAMRFKYSRARERKCVVPILALGSDNRKSSAGPRGGCVFVHENSAPCAKCVVKL